MNSPVELSVHHPREETIFPFSRAELTAGLRRYTHDTSLHVTHITSIPLPQRSGPTIGSAKGIRVEFHRSKRDYSLDLFLKIPLGATRTGTAGAGLREKSLYTALASELPVSIPQLIAASRNGSWIILELLPAGIPAERWSGDDYIAAIDQLILLHDRFWNLGEDLISYPWLARPLDTDFEIHVKAAATGVNNLVGIVSSTLLTRTPTLAHQFADIIQNSDLIAKELQKEPYTLLHGDYFPGNIHKSKSGQMTLFDWQQVAIGPGVLDLIAFITSSQWYYSPLPVPIKTIVDAYRSGIYNNTGHLWNEEAWDSLWDHALLWSFLTQWLDLIASIPEPVIITRIQELENIWLIPVQDAVSRRLRRVQS